MMHILLILHTQPSNKHEMGQGYKSLISSSLPYKLALRHRGGEHSFAHYEFVHNFSPSEFVYFISFIQDNQSKQELCPNVLVYTFGSEKNTLYCVIKRVRPMGK